MYGGESLNGLYLHNDLVLDHEVQPVRHVDSNASVEYG